MSEEKRETKQALLGELESIKDLLSEDEWDDIPVLSDAVSAPASPPSTEEFSIAVQAAPLSEGAARSGNLTPESSSADEASVAESQLHAPLTQLDDRAAGELTSNVNSDLNDTDSEEENRASNVDHQLDLMAAVHEQTETDIAIGESAFADNSSETSPPQVPTSGISETHNSDIDAAVDKLNLDLSLHFDETEFDSQEFVTENFEPVEFEATDFVDGAFASDTLADVSPTSNDFTTDRLNDENVLSASSLSDANPQESDLAQSDLDNTPSEDDFSEYERSQAVDSSERPDFDTDQTDLEEDALLAESSAAQSQEESGQALEQTAENPFEQNISDSESTALQAEASEAFTADELLETSDDDEEPLDSEKLDDDFLAEHVDEIEEELEHDLEELIHDLDALDSDAEMVDVVAFEMPIKTTPESSTETDESSEDGSAAETPIEIDSVANEAPSAIDEYLAELSPSEASNSSLFSSLSQDYDSSSTDSDSDSDSNIEPLLDFTDQQIHTDENGNPLSPGVLPGQQSLFSGAQVKNGTADQNNHPEEEDTHENDAEGYVRPQRPTRATGENPFLPKHIRDRLHTDKTLVDIIKESPLPPPAAARPLSDHVHEAVKEQLPPQLSSESLHHVVEEVIALYMPRIEAELRERLLNEIRRMEPEQSDEGEDEVLGEGTEEILDSQIEREIEDDETL